MSPSPWRKQRHAVKCCNGCVPPKRYPGCGDHCKEYKEEKAKYLADKKKESDYLKTIPVIKDWDFNRYK
jgi:hypothetical protein